MRGSGGKRQGRDSRSARAYRRGSRAGLAAAAGLSLVALLATIPAVGEEPMFPACTRKPTDADIEGAKGAHKAATQFFERADYDRAVQYWRDAYQFDCTKPALLLNIANAYEKKGDRDSAILTLETYLERAPNAPDAQTIADKVANLKAAQGAAVPAPTATATATAEAPPPPPPKEEGDGTTIAPWVVVGIGGAAAIAGAILLPVGLGAVSSAEDACPNRECTDQAVIDEGNSGRTQATVGTIVLAAGGALIAGGLVWQLAFNQPAEATALRVLPAVGPREAGLVVGGSF